MPPSRRRASRPWPASRPRQSCKRCNWSSQLAQGAANRVPKLAAFLLRRGVFDLAQRLEHLPLLGRELGRRPDVNADVQVAVPPLAQARQPLGAYPIRHAGLRARLEPQRRLTERGRPVHWGTERGRGEGDAEAVDEVVAVALKAGIFLDIEHGDEIAARAVARSRHALAAQRQVMVVGDARRHVDLNRLLTLHPSVAAAAMAGVGDDRALAAARRTGRDAEELSEQRLDLAPHFSRAAAGAAAHRLRSRLRAAARAFGTGLEAFDAHRLGRAGGDFGECELQADLDVVSAAPIPSAVLAAEDALEGAATPALAAAEAEVAHEDHERFGAIEVHGAEAAAPPAPATTGATDTLMTEPVVSRAFVGIAEHFVGFGADLELFFGRLVAVVAVGVALHRELAVGLLDVRFARIPLHAEADVEILLHAIRAAPRRVVRCD